MQQTIGQVRLEAVRGDITRQPDMHIIVNAANAQLKGGGGVDGAIQRAAGPALVKASRALGPIEPGEAVITPAFDLPNDWVVHCVGPVYSANRPVARQLARCYAQAMALAEQAQAASIAFPAISAGVYGYPLDEAGPIAVRAVAAAAQSARFVQVVRFVLFSDEALHTFNAALKSLE